MYVLMWGGKKTLTIPQQVVWTVMFIGLDASICCWLGCSDGRLKWFFVNLAMEKKKKPIRRIVKAQCIWVR